MPPIHPIPSLENGDLTQPCKACGSAGNRHAEECWMNSSDWGQTKTWLRYAESKVPQDWKSLLVWNPLTKRWRELPEPAKNRGSLKWRYDKVLIDMIVDEQANSYTIVMTFRRPLCMCVYKSTSNTWVHHHYRPLESHGTAWKSPICANAMVRGRLHYAFLESTLDDHATLATLRVFEINVETGEWKPWKECALQVQVRSFMLARYIRLTQRRDAYVIIRHLALVECMGDMYAVIPTREDEIIISNNNVPHARALVNAHRSHEEDFVAMPVQFHILGLNCENKPDDVNVVLRIRVPQDTSDLDFRSQSLREKTKIAFFPFSCTAKGSVIWVACEDYLLQYDVVSRQSKTEIIRKPRMVDAEVSYRPSFHMEP